MSCPPFSVLMPQVVKPAQQTEPPQEAPCDGPKAFGDQCASGCAAGYLSQAYAVPDPEADWSCAGDGTWQLLSPALACEDIDECAVT